MHTNINISSSLSSLVNQAKADAAITDNYQMVPSILLAFMIILVVSYFFLRIYKKRNKDIFEDSVNFSDWTTLEKRLHDLSLKILSKKLKKVTFRIIINTLKTPSEEVFELEQHLLYFKNDIQDQQNQDLFFYILPKQVWGSHTLVFHIILSNKRMRRIEDAVLSEDSSSAPLFV